MPLAHYALSTYFKGVIQELAIILMKMCRSSIVLESHSTANTQSTYQYCSIAQGQYYPSKRFMNLSTQRRRHQIWPNKIVADNTNPHINTELMLVQLNRCTASEDIRLLLPIGEVMRVERSGVCETGFVGEEKILQKMFIYLFFLHAPTYKLFMRDIVGRKQILHFLKIVKM